MLNSTLKSILNSAMKWFLQAAQMLVSAHAILLSSKNWYCCYCPFYYRLLTTSPIPNPCSICCYPTSAESTPSLSSAGIIWGKSSSQFLRPVLQVLLECLLVQLVQLIQTLLKVCTSTAIFAGIPSQIGGESKQAGTQGVEVGKKRLGYLQTLIQSRAGLQGWNSRKLGGCHVVSPGRCVACHHTHTLPT